MGFINVDTLKLDAIDVEAPIGVPMDLHVGVVNVTDRINVRGEREDNHAILRSMDLVSLQAQMPTVDEYHSLQIWGEVLVLRDDWRCYSSATYDGTLGLIDRFLRAHAVTPGWITPTMVATRPMQLFAARTQHYELWGALFVNGAVIRTWNDTIDTWLLYVADATADAYRYPQGWVRTTEFFGRIAHATPEQ